MFFFNDFAMHTVFDHVPMAGLVSATWTFHVGYRHDPEPAAGLTHLCEHLVADRGSRGGHGCQYRAAAAASFVAATTYPDTTQLTISARPEVIVPALTSFWLSARALVSPADLDHALRTVAEEIDESLFRFQGRRTQWVRLSEQLSAGWPDSHDGFGYDLGPGAVTVSEVRDHFQQFFGAENAVLVISGDISRLPEPLASTGYRPPAFASRSNRMTANPRRGHILTRGAEHNVVLPVAALSDGLLPYVSLLVAIRYLQDSAEFRAIGVDRDLSIGFFGPWSALDAEHLVIVLNCALSSDGLVARLVEAIDAALEATKDGGPRRALAAVAADFAARSEAPPQRAALLGQLISAGISVPEGLDDVFARLDDDVVIAGVHGVLIDVVDQLQSATSSRGMP